VPSNNLNAVPVTAMKQLTMKQLTMKQLTMKQLTMSSADTSWTPLSCHQSRHHPVCAEEIVKPTAGAFRLVIQKHGVSSDITKF